MSLIVQSSDERVENTSINVSIFEQVFIPGLLYLTCK